jgi:FKBP-type peptidyl-prolyl cis-trans isomerase
MKFLQYAAIIVFFCSLARAEEAPALKTKKEKNSYSIGVDVGRSFSEQGFDFDIDVFVRGLKDGLAGKKLLMTEDEMKSTITAFQYGIKQEQEQKMKSSADANQKEGEAFLAANKTKEGVVTLPSGLQYKILKAGQGKKPTGSDTVVCDYRGTSIKGKEFDSSYSRGEPASFPVSGVIAGWTEALKLMPVGSKWQLFIPSNLAYGARGAGADIGPNQTLIFEVELLGIK